MVDEINVGGGGTSGNIYIWNDDKNKKQKSCITIHLNGKSGFISAEGIRIGALFIGSKGDIKKTHFKGDFEIDGILSANERLYSQKGITANSDIFAYKMHINNNIPQDANGDALILGPRDSSNLRLGYHQNYSWIQSHGAKPLTINPLGNNIGIGITDPKAKLHIQNTPQDANGNTLILGSRLEGSNLRLGYHSNYTWIQSHGAKPLAINPIGSNVGIGITDPKAKLHIQNTPQDANGNTLILGSTNGYDSNLRLGYHNNYSWIQSHGAKPLAINPIGNNVGIGTDNPQAKLHVAGDIQCTGDIILLGADCAEEFEIADGNSADSGSVMVINDDQKVQPCQKSYDKRVIGIIAGAGKYHPGIILDHNGDGRPRAPISITGKANCWADASYSPIEIGDLLTTSQTLGHAMNAIDSHMALGSVIGKALSSLKEGKGLVDVLITLQ